MSSDAAAWAVRLEGVTKRYAKGGAGAGGTAAELRALAGRTGQRLRGRRPAPRGTLALDDVSFDVGQGECFGLVGPNGAGKSTALKMVTRISYPTGGRVRVRGSVGALMEVGSGIHPDLTGRENIWLYGSILGISREGIRERFDRIVEFAQLERVVDTQVKYYSSGMQLRLGFSIAAHLEPHVLVVDEALSVGDAAFQARAVRRMRELVRSGMSILLVSHELWSIEALCARTALIDGGRLVQVGDTKAVLARYLTDMENRRAELAGLRGNEGAVRITAATCHDPDGTERHGFGTKDPVEIRLRFHSPHPVRRPHVVVSIADIECSMLDDDRRTPEVVQGDWECRLRIDSLPLRPRLYEIWATVIGEDGFERQMDWLQVGTLRMESAVGTGKNGVVNALSPAVGAVAVDHDWSVHAPLAVDQAA